MFVAISPPAWVPKAIHSWVKVVIEGDAQFPPSLQPSWKNFEKSQLPADVAFLTRLIGDDDDQMREAYIALQGEFTADEQWRRFAQAATFATRQGLAGPV